MDKFAIKSKIDNFIYSIYNIITSLKLMLDKESRILIGKNTKFKNKHKGETCFILATGPSLARIDAKNVDFIKKEITIGVNSFNKTKLAETISPNYYTMIDNLYWGDRAHCFAEVVEKFKACPPIFISDPRAKSIVQIASNVQDHIFIYSKKYPINKVSAELDSGIYAAMNVVSYSILAAIYMGFKRINLLGCDYNAFCCAGVGHAYDDRDELIGVEYNLGFYLKYYHLTTEFHYLIAKLAREKGVEIVNMSEGSILDAYRRENVK